MLSDWCRASGHGSIERVVEVLQEKHRLELTYDEVVAAWEERGSRVSPQSESFAAGTFIVAGDYGLAIRDVSPTAESWWAGARDRDRESFLAAYFAETSGMVERLRRDERDCTKCGGRGWDEARNVRGGTGDLEERKPCARCKTLGHDVTVKFR